MKWIKELYWKWLFKQFKKYFSSNKDLNDKTLRIFSHSLLMYLIENNKTSSAFNYHAEGVKTYLSVNCELKEKIENEGDKV